MSLLTPECKLQFINKLASYMFFSLFIYFFFREILFKHPSCMCYGIEWFLSTAESLVRRLVSSLNLWMKHGSGTSNVSKKSLRRKLATGNKIWMVRYNRNASKEKSPSIFGLRRSVSFYQEKH